MFLGRLRFGVLPISLLLLALAVRVATALPLGQPGYMDAYYYYNVAQRLHVGQGLTDPYLWNFLDHPTGIPHPACLYWMPLSSLLIYPFFALFGASFRVAQIPFVLLSAALALIAYRVALDLSGERRHAALAALLVVFSGYYVIFWVVPDSFAPFAVTASLALYCAGRGLRDHRPVWLVPAGLAAGLAHLARADGVLVLAGVLGSVLLVGHASGSDRRKTGSALGLAFLGYLAVATPWFIRNWLVSGSPLASGGVQALFLRSYDELFTYGRDLTLGSYLAWGWPSILSSKLQGLGFGLINLIATNWMLFLAPAVVVGLWGWRRRIELLPFALYAVLLYATMTVGFTFPGVRGGLFHSSAALLPWWFAAAAAGLDAIAASSVRRSGWTRSQSPAANGQTTTKTPSRGSNAAGDDLRARDDKTAERRVVFAVGALVLAVVTSAFLYGRGVGGWNGRDAAYADVAEWWVQVSGADMPDVRFMVNDAPGFYYHTGLSAVAIPNEDLPVVLAAAHRYDVSYLVLETDHPHPMDALYRGQVDAPGLTLAATLRDAASRSVEIFRVGRGGS